MSIYVIYINNKQFTINIKNFIKKLAYVLTNSNNLKKFSKSNTHFQYSSLFKLTSKAKSKTKTRCEILNNGWLKVLEGIYIY